jgi:hypothetical protein
LYDLATDLGEMHNLAEQRPDVMAKLMAYAKEAHTPLSPGVVYDRALVDKDRRLKLPQNK